MTPQLSVVLGTWNRLEALQSCIWCIRDSVADIPYEIIIVDGGSTDGTLQWLHEQKDEGWPDVTVIEQGELVGACRAYTAGFRLARAPFVVHINDDDEVQGDCVARAYHYMQAHPEAGQVAFAFDLYGPGYRFDVVFGKTYANKGITRRELGDRAQWWPDTFHTYGGDCELSCRIMEMGYEVVGLQECWAHDLATKDELRRINNPTGINPDSETFYGLRKGISKPTGFKRRILHVALNVPGDNQPALERALRSMGEYKQIDWRQLKREKLRSTLIKTCEEWQPSLIFMQLQTGNVVDVETAKRIRAEGRVIVNWSGDVRSPIPAWYFKLGKEIDWTLVTNEDWVREFRSKGIKSKYLDIGFNQEIFHPWGTVAQCEPIVFMGNHYGSFPLASLRLEMVNKLKEEYGKEFGVYGRGWPFGTEWLDWQKEVEHYRGCKIAVGISQFDLQRYTSDRLYRAMGSGAFYLTRHYPGIELDFERGIHLDWWKDLDELKEKVDYYLEHDDVRQRIAREGSELVHGKHTWLDRAAELSAIIGWHLWK